MPTTSPNMNLPIPVVGVDPAPTWAQLIDTCLTLIDSHAHTTGSGVPITPSAINITSDLVFNSNNATALRTTRYTAQTTPIPGTGSDVNEVYVSGVDLYYNDGNGNQVRITQSGGIAGSPGSIANLTSPASASYVALSTKFVWQSAANTSADMDFGSAIMRNDTANSFALTLQPPTLGSNYSITLPALPVSQKFMTMDASGVMSAPWAVDGSTLEIASGTTLQVKDSGVTTAKIADSAVTTAKIADLAVTGAKIANNTISDTQIVAGGISGTSITNDINLPGDAVEANGGNLIISRFNAASMLCIVRGAVNADGSVVTGSSEGFSITKGGAGLYTINFTNHFGATPILVGSAANGTDGRFIVGASVSTISAAVQMLNSSGSSTNIAFHFMAIGPSGAH